MLPDMFTFVSVLVVLIEGIAVYARTESVAMSDEKRLIKHLLQNYKEVGIVGRPVFNTSDTVRVDYGFALIQILDLDEKNQVLTTNAWNRYTWKDKLLTWDPELFGGVSVVRLPPDKIWKPDIVLYNHADDRLEFTRKCLMVVSFDGTVLWIPQSIIMSSCTIDIVYFPYDKQKCTLKFGSWTYDGFAVDLNFYQGLEGVDLNDYIPSNEWELLDCPAVKNSYYYPCCDEPFQDITFNITVRRYPIFYTFVLMLPCVLLSVLTLVVFFTPPESPAKLLLGMSNFVAFFLLLRILANTVPPASSSVPLIGIYYCYNMIMITLSSVISVIIINIYNRNDKRNRIPHWLRRTTIDFLAQYLCLRTDQLKKHRPKQETVTHYVDGSTTTTHGCGRKGSKERKKIRSPVLKYNKWEPPSNSTSNRESPVFPRNHIPATTPPDQSPVHMQEYEQDVKELKRALRNFMNRLSAQDATNRVNMEWRMVAFVVDRVLFILYFLATVIALCVIFPWKEALAFDNGRNSTSS